MKGEPDDVKFVCTDSDTEDEEKQVEESEGKSLLKETKLISEENVPASQSKEMEDQSSSTLFCNWNFVQKMITIAFLWIAYFLCNVAFSTIAPFFPKEARHHQQCSQ